MKMAGVGKNRFFQAINTAKVLAFLIIAAAVAFGFYRLHYGFTTSDEGHSLSVPARYAMGDIPFRDEVLNPLRWFDIMLTPVMRLLPREGSVLFLRRAAYVFHLLCVIAFVVPFRKDLSPVAIAALFAATVYSNVYTYWTPTYHSASADFWMLSFGLWTAGMAASSKLRAGLIGSLAGVSGFAAILCIIPGVALLSVPLVAADRALKKQGKHSSESISGNAFVITSSVLFACSAAILFRSGLLGYLIEDIAYIRRCYDTGLSRAALLLKEFLQASPFAAAHAFFWLAPLCAAYRAKRSPHGSRLALFVLFPALTVIYISLSTLFVAAYVNDRCVINYFEGLCLFSMLFYPAARIWLSRRGANVRFPSYMTPLYAFGVLWHLLLGEISGSALLVSTVITLQVHLAVLTLASERILAGCSGEEAAALKLRLNPAAVMSLCVLAPLMTMALFSTSGDWIWRLHSEFKTSKLTGIRATEAQTREIDDLTRFLSPRLRRGDFLLVFYDNPMINYLTETRASLPTGLPSRSWPVEIRFEFVEQMLLRQRVPRYAVSSNIIKIDPIQRFVALNYRLIYKSYSYYVFELAKPVNKVGY